LGVLLIERQHHTGLQEAVSPAQVGLKGRPQRVPMPLGLGHMLAVTPDPGVIHAQDDALQVLVLDGLLDNRMEEFLRVPGAARKDFVVRRPVFLGVALEADGTGQRALAHAAQDAKSQGQGSFQATLLGKNKSPEPGLFQ